MRSNCAQNRNILFKCPRWSRHHAVVPSPQRWAMVFSFPSIDPGLNFSGNLAYLGVEEQWNENAR